MVLFLLELSNGWQNNIRTMIVIIASSQVDTLILLVVGDSAAPCCSSSLPGSLLSLVVHVDV